MGILELFFKRPRPEHEPQPKEPSAGEIWYIPNESPWPKNDVKVIIIDQKDGWVRYTFGGRIFTDERMRLGAFIGCYKYLEG